MIKVHTPYLKFTLSFILVASAFLITYYAYAQESITTTSEETAATSSGTVVERQNTLPTERGENLEARQEAREERVETRQTMRAERQAVLSEVRQKRILNLSANASNRLDAAIDRLFSIVNRLETRIVKMKESGLDTAPAETKLREAAGYVASARALLSNIDTLVYNATTSEKPLTNWQEVRTTYQEASRLVRASHQSLRETIALLKSASPAMTTEPSQEIE